MNENIDLAKILKDCPKGWELYSCVHGKVRFDSLLSYGDFPICVELSDGFDDKYSRDGKFTLLSNSECCLFPSKDQRDWSKFTAPWYKKEKFDPKTLKPFDRVLARDYDTCKWKIDFYSHKEVDSGFPYICAGNSLYKYCIPYNEDTKHLVGTMEEAPEYYKYWED